VGRSQYSIDQSGDVLGLEMKPEAAAPHLGGRHEAGPIPGAEPESEGASVRPGTRGFGGRQEHEGHVAPGTPTTRPGGTGGLSAPGTRGQAAPVVGAGMRSAAQGSSGVLPSLVRGTPGMPGAPGLTGGPGAGASGSLSGRTAGGAAGPAGSGAIRGSTGGAAGGAGGAGGPAGGGGR